MAMDMDGEPSLWMVFVWPRPWLMDFNIGLGEVAWLGCDERGEARC